MVKNLKVARFENALIFEINNKPISRIDTLNGDTNCSNKAWSSIILNFQKNKSEIVSRATSTTIIRKKLLLMLFSLLIVFKTRLLYYKSFL